MNVACNGECTCTQEHLSLETQQVQGRQSISIVAIKFWTFEDVNLFKHCLGADSYTDSTSGMWP